MKQQQLARCVVCDDLGCEFCPAILQCVGCNRITENGMTWVSTNVQLGSDESLTICQECAERVALRWAA